MKIDLSQKIILVTGASRGIGKSIALLLGKSGAKLALNYNRNEEAALAVQKEIGKRAVLFKGNLSNAMEVTSMFASVIEHFGRLDVLVNNAGIALSAPTNQNDVEWVESWLTTMDVNLNAVGLLCKKSIEIFKTQASGGRIINIASRAAFRGETEEYLAYAASKGAVVALTKSIAKSFGKYGIKSFVVAPGFVLTDMAKPFIEAYGKEKTLDATALDEATLPEHLAPLVAFIASGNMDHATGTTIDINGGSYLH